MSLPVSPVQERLWFLDQLLPDSGPAHHVSTATRLQGRIDVAALRAAIAGLARRHELLRSSFPSQDGRPVRRVAPAGAPPLALEVREVTDPERAVLDVAMTAFDLATGPLARVCLLQIAPDDAVLVLCLSHLISDGWSMGILHRELSALYEAALHAATDPLPPVAYDFTTWLDEARRRADDRRVREEAFWRAQLHDAPECLDVPTDRARPIAEGYRGGKARVRLPADLVARARAVATRLSATPFAVYLVAYAHTLACWSRQRDLVIGAPWANRRSVAQEAVVGPLMEMMLLRVRPAPELPAAEVIRQVRRDALRAMSHSDLGFDRIVAALSPSRVIGRNPLFQAMLLLQNARVSPVALAGCTARAMPVLPPTARLDLALDISPDDDGDEMATLEYRDDLFGAGIADLVGRRFRHVLAQLVATPDAPLGSIDPVDDAERALLANYNATGAAPDEPLLLHELVYCAARRTPDAVAITSEAGPVTYRQLLAWSTAAAHGLARRGVQPGDVVGLCAQRSPEMITAMLAIMSCGAAYLPLEPSYPAQRLAEMCADAGVRLIVTAGDRGQVPDVPAVDLIALQDAAPSHGLPAVTARDIAYVLYTSGSTGRPKGVMVSHRAVTNLLHWAQRELPLSGADRVLGKTPYTFDISVWEIFGTLAAGATLVLAAPDLHRDASYVAALMARERITVIHFVPSMLRGLLSLPDLPAWPDLRYVIAGGEALPAEVAQRLDVPVLNFYGPTEAAVYVSWHTAGDRTAANGTVPIGRPVTNATLHVLDDELRPVPLGAVGELYIGGVQVADGYLRRPGLTATRFLPDPFSPTAGRRLYRTGDLVRRAEDGTIDFVGRRDGQVKVRGFRIELGEIEAALRAHPGIADAAAHVRGDPGAERLVAHVTQNPACPALSPAELATLPGFLARRLPDYMIPVRFGHIAALPLTVSGKLDRNALRGLALDMETGGDARSGGGAPTVALVGPVQAAIAEIWTELLGRPVTDAGADFFALGGDSITSIAVVAGCHRRGLRITVRDVFATPTVAGLAAVATPVQPVAAAEATEATPTEPEPEELILPLGPMQQYAVERVRRAALAGLYVVCFTAAIDDERFDVDAWRETWRVLMRRHPGLRTSFRMTGAGPVQVVHRDPALPFEVMDLRHLRADAAAAHVLRHEAAERRHVIDITDAPQWRMRVFRIGDDRYRVICRLSYLLQDGWSVSVLQNDWYPLYDALRAGREPRLSPAPPTYATQLRHLAARDLAAGRAHWVARSGDTALSPAVGPVLRERSRPAAGAGGDEHQTVPRVLTPAQEQAVRGLAQRERVTLFAALQGAWALVLAGLTGHRRVRFGTISSGRPTTDVHRTYGSFNNMMPTVVDVDAAQPVADLLRRLQSDGAEDRVHDHVPLNVIAADLGVADPVELVDTYIVHENFPIDVDTQRRFARWRPDIAEMRTEHALRMLIWPVDELSFHLSYDARLTCARDAGALMDAYVAILLAMPAAGRVGDLLRDPLAHP
jgi:amino acid adenylation domain-containing protein